MMWFHLMPYPALPEDFNRKHHSVWVDIDPGLFDREIMAETYRTYIEQLVYAEECGFDGICINEHHGNGYGLMPSPNVLGSVLATRTGGLYSATELPSTVMAAREVRLARIEAIRLGGASGRSRCCGAR